MNELSYLNCITGGIYLNYSVSYTITPQTTDSELHFFSEIITPWASSRRLNKEKIQEAYDTLTAYRQQAQDLHTPKDCKLFAQVRQCLFCEHDFYWISVQI